MQKKNSPGRIAIFIAVIAVLVGALVMMNRMTEQSNRQNIQVEADDHDHNGDGQPDHAAGAH